MKKKHSHNWRLLLALKIKLACEIDDEKYP